MAARRTLVVLIALSVAGVLLHLLLRVLLPGGWTGAKLLMLAAFLGTAPWTGLCAANGVLGFTIRAFCRDSLAASWRLGCNAVGAASARRGGGPTRATTPASMPEGQVPPIAIALTVRNEALTPALRRTQRLLAELDDAGAGDAFTLFVLSDSDAAFAAPELAAVAAAQARDRRPDRIRYRRRPDNAGFKAGNVMDFLDRHAAGFALMLVLDADSRMDAAAVLRLVRAMQADPGLAIAQHLTVGAPAGSAFARLFQFGMRAGMRSWATGQAWWQGDAGPYWGHNAVVRIAAFRAHARLPSLPGGVPILSHDQVEAALLRGAGWGVRVLPEEDGSAEANPTCLPDFLARELRWLRGNLQYWHLLRLPGLRPMGRWQLLQAILLFAGAPFYLAFLLGAAWAAATDSASAFPAGPALALGLAWPAALYAPKLLGYLEVLLSPEQRARYGGGLRFACGAAAEIGFTLLLDAVTAVAKTGAVLRGGRPRWPAQNRAERAVSWLEAARLFWPQTALGVLAFAGLALGGWRPMLWALPFAGGLLLAVPLAVLSADPTLGRWLRRTGLGAIPEEIAGRSRVMVRRKKSLAYE
jgi:membrane glycosyltransferase